MMSHPLSITTDYRESLNDPSPYLRRIADAGFTHLHWCQQWNTDFLYGPAECGQIARWLKDFGLSINDIHGSHGREKSWGSTLEYQRLAGLELVRNRLHMAHQLGCDVVILHWPSAPGSAAPGSADAAAQSDYWDRMRRNLDALMPDCRRLGVRIALENMAADNTATLACVFDQYPADYLGFCYDPGHGNIAGNGLDRLDQLKHRLIATHLNDNDGHADQHRLIFSGTVDWPRLASLIAASAYDKPVMSMEVGIDKAASATEEPAFLADAARTGQAFADMVAHARAGAP